MPIDRTADQPDDHSDPAPGTISLDDALRESIVANLESHERREVPLDGRRHAGVAVVVVDSVAGSDVHDPPGTWSSG